MSSCRKLWDVGFGYAAAPCAIYAELGQCCGHCCLRAPECQGQALLLRLDTVEILVSLRSHRLELVLRGGLFGWAW
jgi:hypothetical protein